MADSMQQQIAEKVDNIFEDCDKNEDGKLDKEEFRVFYDEVKENFSEIEGCPDIEDYDAVFAFFDKNGNGGVERAELTAIMQSVADKAKAAE